MQYFQKMREGIDVAPALNAVLRHPELWNQVTIRKQHPGGIMEDVDDILLRFGTLDRDLDTIFNDKECVNMPAFYALPQLRPLIFGLMSMVEGEQLGRVMVSRVKPGGVIKPHIDTGAPIDFYERYHTILSGSSGCLFTSGDETVCMKTGELWWFDNSVMHSAINNSDSDRIHLITDIRTFK